MYLHIAVVWGQTYALHGMEWPLPAFSGSLGGGVASCFFLVEKGTISSPWSLWGSMPLSVCPDCLSLFSVSPGYVARWRGYNSTWRKFSFFSPSFLVLACRLSSGGSLTHRDAGWDKLRLFAIVDSHLTDLYIFAQEMVLTEFKSQQNGVWFLSNSEDVFLPNLRLKDILLSVRKYSSLSWWRGLCVYDSPMLTE